MGKMNSGRLAADRQRIDIVSDQEQHQGDAGAQTPATAPGPAFSGAARRRFTKAGAVAVGAVLTLKSQPGMAANASQCVFAGPSQAGSFAINHSRTPKIGYCDARSPGFWKKPDNRYLWPKQPGSTTASLWDYPFASVFPYYASPYSTKTLGEIICMSGGGLQDVARHVIAAYLNALKGYTLPYLTPDKVKDIWVLHNSSAGYAPAGKVWTVDDISNYIKSTWGGTPGSDD